MDQDQPESEAPHDRRTIDCLDTCSCVLHGNVRRDPSWIARRSLNPQRPNKALFRPPTTVATLTPASLKNAWAGVMVVEDPACFDFAIPASHQDLDVSFS